MPTVSEQQETFIAPAKRLGFWTATVMIPVVVMVGLEMGARVLLAPDAQADLFVTVEGRRGFLIANPGYFSRYFSTGFEPTLAFTPFRAKKPAGSIRVIAMGGSTTVGYPYEHYLGFPERLKQRLIERAPETLVEVINLGATACNSFTLLDIAPRVVSLEPDAVIIYAGHNEYYGAFGAGNGMSHATGGLWLKRSVIRLKHLRLYRLLESLIVRKGDGEANAAGGLTMMERSAGDTSIARDGAVYKQGVRQFERNMQKLVDRLQEAGIPVMVAAVASNLKDQPPLGDDMDAIDTFRDASDAFRQGDTTAAYAGFVEARELDPVRFRAPAAVNRVISTLPGITILDVEKLAARSVPSGIPDSSFFVDHLHPNAAGYDLIAREMDQLLARILALPERDPAAAGRQDRISAAGSLDLKLGELQVYGLKAGFPFRKGVSAERQMEILSQKLDSLQRSGDMIDRFGYQVMSGRTSVSEAMRGAFLYHLSQRDTIQALLHLHSMVALAPFDAEQRAQALRVANTLSGATAIGVLANRLGLYVRNDERAYSEDGIVRQR